MKLTTKGMYGLEVMVYLAMQSQESYISLQTIAKNRKLSMKYLEQIVSALVDKGLLRSCRGKSGGYRLAKHPRLVTVYEVITALEGFSWMDTCQDTIHDTIANQVYTQINEEMTTVLQHYSLEDLALAVTTKHSDFEI